MSGEDCTLSITVARSDLPFLRKTIPHLVRSCRHRFSRRTLVMDLRAPSGDFPSRPGVGTIAELERVCGELRDDGVVDTLVPVDDSPSLRRRCYHGGFDRPVRHTVDFRGAPILNYMVSLAVAETAYLVHFDADMLLHQAPGGDDWIARGIALLRACDDVCAVLPLSGPPHPAGLLHQPDGYRLDRRGFFRFETFTSRVFLVDRARLAALGALPVTWPRGTTLARRLGNLKRRVTGRSALPTWEMMLTENMRRTGACRADLADGRAWSLHPLERSAAYFESLDGIIEQVERGEFPAAQAGHYDLRFDAWHA